MTPRRSTRREPLEGHTGQSHQQAIFDSHARNDLPPPSSHDQPEITELAGACVELTGQPNREWSLLLENPDPKFNIFDVIDLINCDNATFQRHYENFKFGEPRAAAKRLTANLFSITKDIWEMIKELQQNPQKQAFALHLEAIQQQLAPLYQYQTKTYLTVPHRGRNHVPTSPSEGSYFSTGSPAMTHDAECHSEISSSSPQTHDSKKRPNGTWPRPRKAPAKKFQRTFYCLVRGCGHPTATGEGYTKRGYCVNHIRNEHANSAAGSNPDGYILNISDPYCPGYRNPLPVEQAGTVMDADFQQAFGLATSTSEATSSSDISSMVFVPSASTAVPFKHDFQYTGSGFDSSMDQPYNERGSQTPITYPPAVNGGNLSFYSQQLGESDYVDVRASDYYSFNAADHKIVRPPQGRPPMTRGIDYSGTNA